MGSDLKPADARTVLDSERHVPVPGSYQRIWHVSRYVYAAQWAIDKAVLDAGCGEGYGSHLLAQVASSVVGLDYAPVAIEHARENYKAPNLEFHEADLNALDGHDGPFDLITCFEVIEHVNDHDRLLRDFRQRLRPGGILLLSTPNLQYHGASDNAYHVSEVGPAQLRREVRKHFSHVSLFGELEHATRRRALAKLLLDPLYLRRRVRRGAQPPPLAPAEGGNGSAVLLPVGPQTSTTTWAAPPAQIDFSRLLMRVSPITMVLARA